MKTILSLRKHAYWKRVSIFLIAIALVAGMIVSCDGNGDGVKPLDHLRGYGIDIVNIPYIGKTVEVGDQFGNFTATVGWGMGFFNPVDKTYDGVTTGFLNEVCHFMAFGLEGIEPQWWRVTVKNQFGTQELIVAGPITLFVPTEKNSMGEPEGYNCYLNYEVIDPAPVGLVVDDLTDQFASEQNVSVTQAKGFGQPAWMRYNGELMEIVNQDDHGVIYWTLNNNASMDKNEIVVSNLFGQWTVNVTEQKEGLLSLPSEKISWGPIKPPLSHFRCYNAAADTFPYVGETVELEDQFGNFTATVGNGTTLCNPVEKAVNEIAAWELVPISDLDHHLMGYILEGVAPDEWVVEVNNQFGTQVLTVSGPIGLFVPTQKEGHDPPVGLDYYLCYDVTNSPPIAVKVDLSDEFGGGDNDFWVTDTLSFANPVKITHGGNVTNIASLDDHLVFYYATSTLVSTEWNEVDVSNLFGACTLNVVAGQEAALAVPSEKVSYVPVP